MAEPTDNLSLHGGSVWWHRPAERFQGAGPEGRDYERIAERAARLRSQEDRQRVEFYKAVLSEIRDLTKPGTWAVDVSAVYTKVAWALDPLADHRRRP